MTKQHKMLAFELFLGDRLNFSWMEFPSSLDYGSRMVLHLLSSIALTLSFSMRVVFSSIVVYTLMMSMQTFSGSADLLRALLCLQVLLHFASTDGFKTFMVAQSEAVRTIIQLIIDFGFMHCPILEYTTLRIPCFSSCCLLGFVIADSFTPAWYSSPLCHTLLLLQ